MAIYSVWSNKDGDKNTMISGEGHPKAVDGSLLSDCEVLLWRIEAATWEEASAIHHLRMGWEPYRPMGESSPCPKCGAAFYPQGSGQCWRCGKVDGV